MARFFLDKAMSPRLRTESSIISPVFVINLVGSFLYGLLIMPVSILVRWACTITLRIRWRSGAR